MNNTTDPTPGLPFLRRYWRGLLFRQVLIWIVMMGLLACLRPTDLTSAWPAVLIAGVILNLAWTLVA